ncbi:hypothetical protein [Pedobacter sp.]|uniref:hypothetical protein n=1 Tax=Pedobacter sp. TaxID=1411316 RepID=UPI0031E09F06
MCIRLKYFTIFFLFGIQCAMAQTGVRNDAGLQGDAGAVSGFFETASPVNYPAGASSWWHLLDVRHSNQVNNYAMQMAGSFFDQNFYLRKTNGNAQQPWLRILTEYNGVLSSGNINIETSAGQSFFTGRQLGDTYGYGAGIFRALTDNPNGSQNFYFDGVTAGNRLFSVRADGQGYFAGGLGIDVPNPMAKLHIRKMDAFSDGNASGSTIDNLLLIQTPYTSVNPGSTNGAGYKWGIQLWGRNDVGQLSADKSVGIYAVSEDPGLGFNRSVGLAIHTSPFDQANREVLRVAASGFLGLGTPSPREKFDLWGGKMTITGDDHNGTAMITTYNGLALYSNNQLSNGISISPSGNIGIGTGTAYAGAKLHVQGGAMVLGNNSVIHNTDGYLSLGNILENSSPVISDWTSKTTMLLNGLDYSTIGFHDSGSRVDFIRVGNGTMELGYDGGFGAPNIKLPGGIWNSAGNVGIGMNNPSEKLTVNGKIKAREIRVDGSGAPDYVFEENYRKLSLGEIEQYIKVNKHLPEVPSAKEFEKEGMAVGEMNKLLLKKIEELTLHLIEQEKIIRKQQVDIDELKKNSQTRSVKNKD